MANAASYNRKGAHNITMPSELDEAFKRSSLFKLNDHPGSSRDVLYLEELKLRLKEESKNQSKELVIGIWSRPYGGPAQIAGYAFYERNEAEYLIKLSKDEQFSVDPFFGGFYDEKWFDERITRVNYSALKGGAVRIKFH